MSGAKKNVGGSAPRRIFKMPLEGWKCPRAHPYRRFDSFRDNYNARPKEPNPHGGAIQWTASNIWGVQNILTFSMVYE